MIDKNLLHELIDKFKETRNSKNYNRCVGFGTQDFHNYYFSMSGFEYDYKGFLYFGTRNKALEQNYINIKKAILDFLKGNRLVEDTYLFDNCLTTKLRNSGLDIYLPINILDASKLLNKIGIHTDEEYKRILRTSYSCVERKIIFSKFQQNIKGNLFVSKKPCDLCSPFTDFFNVYDDVEDVYKK